MDDGALELPGDVANPDDLHREESGVSFIRQFLEAGKPAAAIRVAPWLLAAADVLGGRRATAFHSISGDVSNGAAEFRMMRSSWTAT